MAVPPAHRHRLGLVLACDDPGGRDQGHKARQVVAWTRKRDCQRHAGTSAVEAGLLIQINGWDRRGRTLRRRLWQFPLTEAADRPPCLAAGAVAGLGPLCACY